MTAQLNHTIVYARNKQLSATFLADILGVPTSPPVARFLPVALDNGVTLDYMNAADMGLAHPTPQHYAFLVSEEPSMPPSPASPRPVSPTTPNPTVTVLARSTTTSAAAEASTSPTPTDTTWNCSPATWPGGRPRTELSAVTVRRIAV